MPLPIKWYPEANVSATSATPRRGRITNQKRVEYDSWAECGNCGASRENLPSPTRGRVAAELKALGEQTQVEMLLADGWTRTRAFGWTCPSCSDDLAKERDSKREKSE